MLEIIICTLIVIAAAITLEQGGLIIKKVLHYIYIVSGLAFVVASSICTLSGYSFLYSFALCLVGTLMITFGARSLRKDGETDGK